MKFLPQTFDVMAHYEPQAEFAMTARLRSELERLGDRYSSRTFMAGKHSGRPVMHTDVRGISVAARIEISRIVFRPSQQPAVLADVFRLFNIAADEGLTSGPLWRLVIDIPRKNKNNLRRPRSAASEAYSSVFGEKCCFLARPKQALEIGRAVVHQTLLEHLQESGPYHHAYEPRIQAVRRELHQQPGRYENHRFFVRPAARTGGLPHLDFCYSGDRRDSLVELAMRQKTEERMVFVGPEDVSEQPDSFVSLSDYEHAARRFGTLWVMLEDVVRPLVRDRAAGLYLFMDESLEAESDRWFSWKELFDRQRECEQINRASRQSPSNLDMSLRHLVDNDLVVRRKDAYRLQNGFEQCFHTTFYELGLYERRLAQR
jgi:hypothetical protein